MTNAAIAPSLSARPASDGLAPAHRQRFQDDGFAIVPHLLEAEETARFRAAALAYADSRMAPNADAVFRQLCTVHARDPVLRGLTFHPRVVAAVTALAGGRSMRLYHDQILIKDAGTKQASEFHQDRPYWPLEPGETISIWIALDDCPRERGCMSFIPGSHRRTGLALQVIVFAHDLFDRCPALEWAEQVVAPLQAGGATFHQGWTAHRAGPNESTTPRVAFSAIFVESHVRATKDLAFIGPDVKAGEVLPDSDCPRIC